MKKKRVLSLVLLAATAALSLFGLLFLLSPATAAESADMHQFTAVLTGAQENPPVDTAASGVARFTAVSSDTLDFEIAVRDIANITAAHIHVGAVGQNGGVVVGLYNGSVPFDPDNPISGSVTLTSDQMAELMAGNYYVNVHTSSNPSGEIRGQIHHARTHAFQTALSGAQEVPAVASHASGQAFLTLSPDMSQLYYRVLVADIRDITASHIHGAPAGQNGGVVFGLYDGSTTFDPQNPISGMVEPTLSQVATLLAGDYYINVHTTSVPSGEIRGQVAPFVPRSHYHALLTGHEEVPPVDTTAVGVARFGLAPDLSTLDYHVAVADISNITASHLHTAWPGQNGGVAHGLYNGTGAFDPDNPIDGQVALSPADVLDLISGYYYVNVHTSEVPSGAIRGQVEGASLFGARLTGDQEVPPVTTEASGRAVLALSDDATTLHYRVMVSDIPTVTASHIHGAPAGQNGGVVFGLYTGTGVFDEDNPIDGALTLTDENVLDLVAGNYYINVHTTTTPSGEIRGQVMPHRPGHHYAARLTGDQEVPPVTTDATGRAHLTLDAGRNTLHYYVMASDIVSVTASHIHKAPTGVNGPVVFPLFMGQGSFDADHPVGNGVGLSGENLVDLLTGYYYINVHTSGTPSGEIRGQIMPPPRHLFLPIAFKSGA